MTCHNLTLADGTKMIALSPVKDREQLMRELERDKVWKFKRSDELKS